jgi:hypothetical protein
MKTNLPEQSWSNAWIVTSVGRLLRTLINSKRYTTVMPAENYTNAQTVLGFAHLCQQHAKNRVKSSRTGMFRAHM